MSRGNGQIMSRNARTGMAVISAAFLAWMTVITVQIATAPQGGEESPERLRAAVVDALASADPGRVQMLFHERTAGPHYAEALVDRWAGVPGVDARVVERDHRYLRLSARTPSGAECSAWPIGESEGRWFLDATPAPADLCRG
ncbi:hypothetical protein L6E12_28735 [Actinokineospora sp. PR83]|uniref:hypothetical protein n=1 Tax=Actinokineospora sp. PR83 TaxID=2884908 RepID=UPI001F189EA0|nr:hypothetical protein [Actinokineospora sp. PR83]MCG8919767.1 hypothetical protein [Actinokineospora sp. PR83]